MTPQQQLLQSREPFYAPASIELLLACGDERQSDREDFIGVFGGAAANAAYNLRLVSMLDGNALSSASFASDTAAMTTDLLAIDSPKVHPAVHSSHTAENGKKWDTAAANDIDCGYLKKRQAISQLIADNADDILQQAKQQSPALFADEANVDFAKKVLQTHGVLAAQNNYFSTGRDVANAAITNGAATMLVSGEHDGVHGIINRQTGTAINRNKTRAAGMPTYEHASWVMADIYNLLQPMHPNSPMHMQIADLIDTLGTMMALGVTTVATRI